MLPVDTAVELPFGPRARWAAEPDLDRLTVLHPGPASVPDAAAAYREALAAPLALPTLDRAVIAEDRVCLVLDPELPAAPHAVAAVWGELARAGVDPGRVTLLHATPAWGAGWGEDPRSALPAGVRDAVSLVGHHPQPLDVDEDGHAVPDPSCAYLASTGTGERIYLARELVEADVTVTLGTLRFDPLTGVSGTHSAFYPALSDHATRRRTRGRGHDELRPEDERPLRQTADEIGWLLGTLFTVQAIPAADGGVAAVLAGGAEEVLRRGRERLDDAWRVTADDRADAVIVAVAPAADPWAATARALDAARRLVTRGGRIAVLCDLRGDRGPGMTLLSEAPDPQTARKALRTLNPPDFTAAAEWAAAARHASLFLLDAAGTVAADDLFADRLDSPRALDRLLAASDRPAILAGGQFVFAEVS